MTVYGVTRFKCVCVLFGLRNRAVWGNYEVVVFQASVSDCSISRLCCFMINTFIIDPRPTCLSRFLDYFVSPLLPPPISSVRHLRTSHLHPLPTSFPGTERRPTGRCPHPPPASLRRSLCTQHPTPYACVCLRVPHRSPPCVWPQPTPRSLPILVWRDGCFFFAFVLGRGRWSDYHVHQRIISDCW